MKCSTCGAGNNFDSLPFTCEYCGARNLLKNHSPQNNQKLNDNNTHKPGDYINQNDENRIKAIQFYKQEDYDFAHEYFNKYLSSYPDDFQVWIYQIKSESKILNKSNFLDKFDLIDDTAEELIIRLEKLKTTKTEETETLPDEDQYELAFDYLKKAQKEIKEELGNAASRIKYEVYKEVTNNSDKKDAANLAIKHIKILKRSYKYYFTRHEHLINKCFRELLFIFMYLNKINLMVDDEIKYYIDELSYMNKHGKHSQRIMKELKETLIKATKSISIITVPDFFLENVKNIPNLDLNEKSVFKALFVKVENKNVKTRNKNAKQHAALDWEGKEGCMDFVWDMIYLIILLSIVIFIGRLLGWF